MPPGFFRGMHTWLPNGLGTDLLRGLEYFRMWSVASILALFAATGLPGRHTRAKARAVA